MAWNDLFGFPGETVEDYNDQIKIFPHLEHLTPPNSVAWLIYARGNEYEVNREQYGLKLKPAGMYDFTCPDEPSFKEDVAIYFEPVEEERDPAIVNAGWRLRKAADNWREQYYSNVCKPRLDMAEWNDALLVIDTRSCNEMRAQLLIGAEAEILRLCRQPMAGQLLANELEKTYSETQINQAMISLMIKKLIVKYKKNNNNIFLALPLEFSAEEIKKRDMDDFRLMFQNRKSFKSYVDEAMQGASEPDAIADRLTQIAESMNMCFTGKEYLEMQVH